MPESTAAERDTRHLMRALDLAAEARGKTSPNPLVGAVLVKDGRTIGEGFHHRAGDPHAERMALAACSEDPAGATMYVTLEPCCHHGRTPPCTDAIVEAGIRRVVIASDDPTAKAAGRGAGILRDEGIRVDHVDGEAGEAARLLNQPFRKHARTGRPLVVFKAAMTLDGKVATASGDSQWISNEASRERAHHWREEADAVAVGIGTALADDPQLTARAPGVERQPRRVVFDSTARLPLDSQLVPTAGEVSDDRRLHPGGRPRRHGTARVGRRRGHPRPGLDRRAAGVRRARRARRARRPAHAAGGRPAPGRRFLRRG